MQQTLTVRGFLKGGSWCVVYHTKRAPPVKVVVTELIRLPVRVCGDLGTIITQDQQRQPLCVGGKFPLIHTSHRRFAENMCFFLFSWVTFVQKHPEKAAALCLKCPTCVGRCRGQKYP